MTEPSPISEILGDHPLAEALLDSTRQDPEVAVALERLRLVVARHQEMIRRLGSAQIELDIARVSFKHRYSVLNPALFPKQPIKPNTRLILGGGVFAGLLLSVLAAVALDIWRRRILERWQIERLLGVPVLAELDRK
jgi:uncharacterized protein involved in exopolysaccharide biosynthesis